MHKRFNIFDKMIVPADNDSCVIDFYINPDDSDKQTILKDLDFDEHTLVSSLDADEISRIEFEKDYTFIIWKRPNNYSFDSKELNFKVSSIGFILSKDNITIILADDYELYGRREFNKISSLTDYFLKILSYIIRHYVDHIKAINIMSKELQDKINISFENKYLIQMFNLGESLVYYIDAIGANNTVLAKLKNNAKKLGFSDDEIDTIDDLIIENNQCYKQAEIYSTILSGLMDARASIVNNNMNVLLKKLTIINIIFLPLNLIAGIGGMSEFSEATTGISWEISYTVFIISMIFVGWLSYIALSKIDVGNSKKSIKKYKNLKLKIKRFFKILS